MVCAGTLFKIMAWLAARGKFKTRFGRSAVAVNVALSPGHKIMSLEVMLTDCAFATIEVNKMNEKNKNFFIISKWSSNISTPICVIMIISQLDATKKNKKLGLISFSHNADGTIESLPLGVSGRCAYKFR